MSNAILPLAVPVNEPVRSYAPGSPEKKSLKQRLKEMASGRFRQRQSVVGIRRSA